MPNDLLQLLSLMTGQDEQNRMTGAQGRILASKEALLQRGMEGIGGGLGRPQEPINAPDPTEEVSELRKRRRAGMSLMEVAQEASGATKMTNRQRQFQEFLAQQEGNFQMFPPGSYHPEDLLVLARPKPPPRGILDLLGVNKKLIQERKQGQKYGAEYDTRIKGQQLAVMSQYERIASEQAKQLINERNVTGKDDMGIGITEYVNQNGGNLGLSDIKERISQVEKAIAAESARKPEIWQILAMVLASLGPGGFPAAYAMLQSLGPRKDVIESKNKMLLELLKEGRGIRSEGIRAAEAWGEKKYQRGQDFLKMSAQAERDKRAEQRERRMAANQELSNIMAIDKFENLGAGATGRAYLESLITEGKATPMDILREGKSLEELRYKRSRLFKALQPPPTEEEARKQYIEYRKSGGKP